MKIRRVGNELFYADGQTDIAKATVAFRNFVNAPKKAGILEVFNGFKFVERY
jgi:hypothetical protein